MIGYAKAKAALESGARVMVTNSPDAQGGGILVDQRPDTAPVRAGKAGAVAGARVGRAVRDGYGADARLGGVV